MKIMPIASLATSVALFGIAAWMITSSDKQSVPSAVVPKPEARTVPNEEPSELLAKRQIIKELEASINSLENEINAHVDTQLDEPGDQPFDSPSLKQQLIAKLQEDPQLLQERMQSSFEAGWGAILKKIGVDQAAYNAIAQLQLPLNDVTAESLLSLGNGEVSWNDPYELLAEYLTEDQLAEFKRQEQEQNLAQVRTRVELQMLQHGTSLSETNKQWLIQRLTDIELAHYTFTPSKDMSQREGDNLQIDKLKQLRAELPTLLNGNELAEAQTLLDRQIMLANLTFQFNQQLQQ
jgi:hypothetical protein